MSIKKSEKLFLTNFLAFQTTRSNFDFDLKKGNYFLTNFPALKPFWSNFDLFSFDHIFCCGIKIFVFRISSSWVNYSWHDEFQLPGRSRCC